MSTIRRRAWQPWPVELPERIEPPTAPGVGRAASASPCGDRAPGRPDMAGPPSDAATGLLGRSEYGSRMERSELLRLLGEAVAQRDALLARVRELEGERDDAAEELRARNAAEHGEQK